MSRPPFSFALLFCISPLLAFPTASVSGGITLNGYPRAFLYTWNTPLPVTGSGWTAGESIAVSLFGPLNWPGVAPASLNLAQLSADAAGNFSSMPVIPYDSGITGASARIPRPGLYGVVVTGARSGLTIASDFINVCPNTYTGAGLSYDWGHERGGREGVLPGGFRSFSPERADPEWLTVWSERPVEIYATVSSSGDDAADQPAYVSPSDNPITHYGHDSNTLLVPDPAYLWLIGTSNYYSTDVEPDAETGRFEVEWETLNAGSTDTYGQGNIGLPLWAKPTVGDRVYMVGRWILDAGHPEIGDRTEVHPPRLLATMRKRPAIASSGAAATQVDIYVSGHGGGANHMPAGLSATLDQGGWGGGRIRDALTPADQATYYRAGPLSAILSVFVIPLIENLVGASLSGQIYPTAGPSAFPWGGASPEEHPINDMDYDFDVPLSAPPNGAATPLVEMTQQPQHTTAVSEVIRFTNPVNGVPTTAHIHLPYNGADNGIYARTLRFSWDVPPPAPAHYQVSLNRLKVVDTDGKWQMWADVSGQWSYLSGLAPSLLQTKSGSTITLPANQTDVWLASGDTLRIFVQGYRANCLDGYLGKLFGMTSYQAGIAFLQNCGPLDNDDLGGALLQLNPPVAPGQYTIAGTDRDGGSHFSVDVTVNQIPGR